MKNVGHLTLHRKLADWEWYKNQNVKALFIHCLIKANWEDKSWRGITIKRGQFITSLPVLAAEIGLSVQQIRTCKSTLESTREITCKSTNKYTLITVENYALYQHETSPSNTQTNMQINTPPNTPTNTPPNTSKVKNKRIKEIYTCSFDSFWEIYPRKTGKKKALASWMKIAPDEQLTETICTAIEKQKKSDQWTRDGGQFIPHPATWLNGERWNDEVDIRVEKPDVKKFGKEVDEDWLRRLT